MILTPGIEMRPTMLIWLIVGSMASRSDSEKKVRQASVGVAPWARRASILSRDDDVEARSIACEVPMERAEMELPRIMPSIGMYLSSPLRIRLDEGERKRKEERVKTVNPPIRLPPDLLAHGETTGNDGNGHDGDEHRDKDPAVRALVRRPSVRDLPRAEEQLRRRGEEHQARLVVLLKDGAQDEAEELELDEASHRRHDQRHPERETEQPRDEDGKPDEETRKSHVVKVQVIAAACHRCFFLSTDVARRRQ